MKTDATSTHHSVKTRELLRDRAGPANPVFSASSGWLFSVQLSGLLFCVYLTSGEAPEREEKKKKRDFNRQSATTAASPYIHYISFQVDEQRTWTGCGSPFFLFLSLIYLCVCVYR